MQETWTFAGMTSFPFCEQTVRANEWKTVLTSGGKSPILGRTIHRPADGSMDAGQTGAEAANLFNHRNYDIPDMNVDDGPGAFGVITALQTAEGAGPRNIELTARITF